MWVWIRVWIKDKLIADDCKWRQFKENQRSFDELKVKCPPVWNRKTLYRVSSFESMYNNTHAWKTTMLKPRCRHSYNERRSVHSTVEHYMKYSRYAWYTRILLFGAFLGSILHIFWWNLWSTLIAFSLYSLQIMKWLTLNKMSWPILRKNKTSQTLKQTKRNKNNNPPTPKKLTY
jgi:hypothetical protein